MLEGYYIKKIGQNKGAPRVWLEGSQTMRAGFSPGHKFDVVVHGQTVVLQSNPDGTRVVSAKKAGDKINPVIDLNSKELLAIFDGMSSIRVVVKKGEIYLLPLASEIKKQERFKRLKGKLENGDPLTIGSMSHGAGVLSHAIHSGLQAGGIRTEIGFTNEIRGELLEHAAVHNDAWSERTQIFAGPMQELAFDERGVAHIPKVEVLEMGLPCSGASRAGKSKRALEHPEAHPEVGHLVVAALVIVNKSNAAVVVLENVPEYAHSASADILRNQLRDMGYTTHERVLNGKEWGSLENRNRWCMVAVTQGIAFDFDQLMPPSTRMRQVGDILDPSIGPDDERWRSFQYLKDKEERDRERGNGFGMQVVDPCSEAVPTLRKGYHKGGSTDPLLRHPENPDLLRQFTAAEHARIKGVPEHLVDGLSNTIAHEVLGQGVVYQPFKDVGEHLGNALSAFAGRAAPASAMPPRVGNRQDAADAEDWLREEAASLAHEVVATLRQPDTTRGRYVGVIVAIDRDIVIQDVGREQGVVHTADRLDRMPQLGETVRVSYDRGHGKVQERERAQMTLGI